MKYIFSFSLVLFLIFSCNQAEKYDINDHFEDNIQDTILTNIIIEIYKVPRGVHKSEKRDPKHRSLYVSQIDKFQFLKYHVDEDGFHYFYILRPARNADNLKRGVAGRYKIDKGYNLLEFEEIFNTPMLESELVKSRGEDLWADLMYFKNVDRYISNKDYIEFPNENAKYDKNLKEWVY